ncbi:MAG: BatD family protein [Candidatus Cloacimonetes bacterium]|nr:BatD family protein [Candidatus Cloacimonadota bacterium]
MRPTTPVLLIFLIITLATTLPATLLTTLNAPDSLRVGERFTLEVALEAPSDADITPPTLGPLGQFELLGIEHEPPRDNNATHRYTLRFAAFESGDLTIPELPFAIGDSTLFSSPQPLSITSVLTPLSTLNDIAAPMPVRPGVWDIVLPLLALLLAAYILWRVRWRRRQPVDQDIATQDTRPAWIVALEMLADLRQQEYLEHDEMVPWYFGLSMVMRTFIERHTGVNAVEMTTSEILRGLPELSHRQRVIEFLRTADGIKFARRQPPAGDASAAADWLESYLHSFERAEQTKEQPHD